MKILKLKQFHFSASLNKNNKVKLHADFTSISSPKWRDHGSVLTCRCIVEIFKITWYLCLIDLKYKNKT